MPIIGVKKSVIDRFMGRVYSRKEFEDLLFDFGLELDGVIVEKTTVQEKRGINLHEKDKEYLCEEEIYKIELPANRCDLLCIEGLSRALRIFMGESKLPLYRCLKSFHRYQIIIEPEVIPIRPFIIGAILVGVKLDADSYASFIDLQDKLHQNICRKRALVAIGTHDLDTVQGPFYYKAEIPSELKFIPLSQMKEYTAEQMMVLYSKDSHLKPYLPIISDKERYPVIRDVNGVVLSMPPIINGEHSKIHIGTRNILIEVTGMDLEKAKTVLNIIVAMFSQYASNEIGDNASFCVEPVEVVSADGTRQEFPDLHDRSMDVSISNINKRIGLDLKAEEMCFLINRMSLRAQIQSTGEGQNHLKVLIPITRGDILHECDVAEDVAIAYGFNRIKQKFPEAHTIGEPFCLNKLTDLLRYDIAAAGWTETLNFTLCNRDDISTKLKKPCDFECAVKISNPKNSEFQVARTSLISGLLKTIAFNKDMPLPLRLFEIQDVVLKDPSSDVGARNERRLCAVYYGKSSGFEIIHGLLCRVMQLLGIRWTKDQTGYYTIVHEDPMYLNGRCAKIIGPAGITLGTVGVLHPDVITAFGLALPISTVDITLEPFL